MNTPPQAGASLISELRLPAHPSQLPSARAYAARAAAAFGLSADDCYDFAYAVNEAVTNAIRHGAPDEQGHIHLSVVAHAELLTLAVRDRGTFTAPPIHTGTMSEHGRGLALMRILTDEVRLSIEPASTTVYLSKAHFPSNRAPLHGD